MDGTLFTCLSAGRIVERDGYQAFVPAVLPPEIPYNNELVMSLSEADAALSELAGLGRLMPNPHLLITPYMHREAVLSSRIEGTRASLSDVLLQEVEVDQRTLDHMDDIREIRNYIVALQRGIAELRDRQLPFNLDLVRAIHERLMMGVRGDMATPGRFRRKPNWIGPPGSSLGNAAYVPPPPEEMMEALADWERFIQQRRILPDLIQCALMHAQFETIHPFLDGNGRVGRLLIPLFLMERGRLPQPLLYMSAYLEARHREYFDLLQQTRTTGDWGSWIRFFLTGVESTARSAVRQASQLMDLRENYRARLINRAKALALVDELFVNPYSTVARAATILKSSGETARKTMILLEQQGIIEEITGRGRDRIYLARPVLDALEDSNSDESSAA